MIWGHTRESVQIRTSAWRKRSAARSVRRSLAPGPAPTKQTGWFRCWLESEALVVVASSTTDLVLPEPSAWHSSTGRCESLPHRRVAELPRIGDQCGVPRSRYGQSCSRSDKRSSELLREGSNDLGFPSGREQTGEQTAADSRSIRRGRLDGKTRRPRRSLADSRRD